MDHGFTLYIDEAGDEGLDRIRPLHADGASEYFILCGVLIRSHRLQELTAAVAAAKLAVGLRADAELHFKDLDHFGKLVVITELAKLRIGIVAIASNKRNMLQYRNRRIEAKEFEIVRGGRVRPVQYNWFYNHMFRYLLERASAECAKWTKIAYGDSRPIRIVFSHRKGFRYSQTKAYLHKLSVTKHPRGYFNNKRQIDWSVVNPSGIENLRSKAEPGLQFADCVASALYRAVDESWFGSVMPELAELLAPRLIRSNFTPREHGFTLLPDGFAGPLSNGQRRSLRAMGYRL